MAGITTELMQARLPDIVQQLGLAIAEAQQAMDRASIQTALLMSDPENGAVLGEDGERKSLLELGFAPTFYQIQEANVEARVAFSMARSSEVSLSVGATVGGAYYFVMFAASVNASYTNKYSFEASGSSAISARISAIPPPSILTTLLAERQQKLSANGGGD